MYVVERRSYGMQAPVEDKFEECVKCGIMLSETEMTVWSYKGTRFIGKFCSLECADDRK